MELPDWLTKSEVNDYSKNLYKPSKRKSNYLKKTLIHIARVIEKSIFSEKTANKRGFLQKINPNLKLIFYIITIILTSFIINIYYLMIIYSIIILLAFFSKVYIKNFILRVWIFVLFFSGIIAFPLIFNLLSPGNNLIELIRLKEPIQFFGFKFLTLSITYLGLYNFFLFVFRIVTIVSLTTLFTLTTNLNKILKSLKTIGIPKIFILIISLTYKFIFIFLLFIQDLYLAKKSRIIKKEKNRTIRRWIASTSGITLLKTKKMTEESYQAMISRGFTGDIK